MIWRFACLVLLAAYRPLVEGYLWYAHHWDYPVLYFSRNTSSLPVACIAAILGRRLGWITAPAVTLISGLGYTFVEAAYKGDRDFAENLFGLAVLTAVAWLLGLLISRWFARNPK